MLLQQGRGPAAADPDLQHIVGRLDIGRDEPVLD
jgi:hypothetical protein